MWNGTHRDPSRWLKFNCDDEDNPDCFGQGYNFGSAPLKLDGNRSHAHSTGYDHTHNGGGSGGAALTHLTCSDWRDYEAETDLMPKQPRPFQEQDTLPLHGIYVSVPTTLYDICYRPECIENGRQEMDSNIMFNIEIVLSAIFTIELILRILAARRALGLLVDPFFFIDFAAILPFFIEVGAYLSSPSTQEALAFSEYLGSCDERCRPTLLYLIKLMRVLRIFKLTRHHSGVRILYDTVHTSWRKLVIPFFFLVVMSIILAIMFYITEAGYKCMNVGGVDESTGELRTPGECYRVENIWGHPVNDLRLSHEDNTYVNGHDYYVAWDGHETKMNTALEGYWLAWVSLTSVGYGRIYPRKNIGRLVGVFGMLFGSFYLAMPLYIIGGSFYQCWKKNEAKEAQIKKFIMPAPLAQAAKKARVDATGNSQGLYVLPAVQCTNVWKYKNIAYSLEKCSNALKNLIERAIADAEAKSRSQKRKHSEAGGATGIGAILRSTSIQKNEADSPGEKKLTDEEIRERCVIPRGTNVDTDIGSVVCPHGGATTPEP